MTLSLATTAQQWALFSGVVLAVGCVAWTLYIGPTVGRSVSEADSSSLRALEGRIASAGVATASALIVVWLLRGVLQLVTFRDPFVPIAEDISFLLFDLFWGTVWIGQGVVLLLLLVAFAAARPPRTGSGALPGRVIAARWIAGGLGVALVATLAMSSHAMGVESARSLAVTADGVHLLAAGTWIGSLTVVIGVGRGVSPRLFAAQVRAFSPMAVGSVALLTVMGIGLAWTHLQTVSDLWTGPYGRILSAKLLAAAVVFLLGFLNWRRGLPSLDDDAGVSKVQRVAAVELSAALAVLLLTAVLVHSPQP